MYQKEKENTAVTKISTRLVPNQEDRARNSGIIRSREIGF
jgi:hypothetical protein